MTPFYTFLFGLLLLGLFAWYFFADSPRSKRILGSVLTVLLTAFCIQSTMPLKEKIVLGLDLKGGSSFLLRLVAEPGQVITKDKQEQAVEVIRKRIDAMGMTEPVITPTGTDRITVQVPGLAPEQIAQVRERLAKVARLEFRLVHWESAQKVPQIEQGLAVVDPGYRIETYNEKIRGKDIQIKMLVKIKPDLGGESVVNAHAFYDQRGPGVALKFDKEGGEKFDALAEANQGHQFAIVLDGEIQSAPTINEKHYGGQAVITGHFNETEARNLASVLENPLSTPVVIEEQRVVSPTLGADSIRSGVYAGLLGLALTVLFILIFYQFAGIVATIALALNVVLIFGIMAMFGFTLTLPGIAGIVLTVGMAVDANVLIYERLKEELATGKSLRASLEGAYNKAFSAIFDANVTTLITAGILFWKATGSVKGFAVTLTVGIISSMFTALLTTRNMFAWLMEAKLIKRLGMLTLFGETKFDFLGKRIPATLLSLVLILGTFAIIGVKGKSTLGVDFQGGDLVNIQAKPDTTLAQIRDALTPMGYGDSLIQPEQLTGAAMQNFSIRVPLETGEKVAAQLQTALPDAGITMGSLDRVGPVVGKELAKGSLYALALSMVGILIYVSFRFEFSFAVGAIVAVIHDVVITLGILAILGHEYSLITVGAILTIAGYSINDTIVVFDRIREGLQNKRKGTIEEIMNASINETLSRTLLTGGTTLLSLLALYIFGGVVLKDFALIILVGILVGTYSSIYIAAPIVLWWSGRKAGGLIAEVRRPAEEAGSTSGV